MGAALSLGLVGAVGTGGLDQAQADSGDQIVFKRDTAYDVKSLPVEVPGKIPGKVARGSIDLRWISMVEQTGGVQITVKLGRLLLNSKYDQVVDVQMKPGDSAETWFLDVALSGQEPTSAVASYSEDLSGDSIETCSPLVVTVDPDSNTLSLMVPDRCLPTTAAKIRVYSSLGTYPASGPGYSVDKLTVRGSYLMHS